MKVIVKLTVLIMFIMSILGAVTVWHISIDKERLLDIFNSAYQRRMIAFEDMVRLEGSFAELLAFDYTYWDEMVDFVKTRDEKWAKENIDPALLTFKTNAIWVYDIDGKNVYAVDNVGGYLEKELPGSVGSVKKIFPKDARFAHFFAETPGGFVEVRGATIHKAADRARKFAPEGFFFTARVLNEDHIKRLESYMGGMDISIRKDMGTPPSLEEEIELSEITFSRSLKDWRGEIAGYYVITGEAKILKDFKNSSRFVVRIFLVIFAVVILALVFSLSFWINRPLWMICKSLENEDPGEVVPLLKRWDEFGRIAQLIDNFFQQRKALVGEIDRRKKTEEEFNAKISQLKQFKDIAVSREIRMIELKKEINKLSKELGRAEPYDSAF
ncbi:MAG: CHASE4 domain-containing protein [Candidatus Omnitrophica bacterium]|nr:CHASE4 domain-containing protein [Candidatus Omnitrophota bacterium]